MIRKTIDKVANFASELDLLDYEINMLSGLAGAIVENDVKNIDIILETLPNSGARAMITPIYPTQRSPFPLGIPVMIELSEEKEEPKAPQPIGFYRVYDPKILPETQGMITIQLEVNSIIATAMIDTLLNRLKKRKAQIIRDTKQIMKKKPQ